MGLSWSLPAMGSALPLAPEPLCLAIQTSHLAPFPGPCARRPRWALASSSHLLCLSLLKFCFLRQRHDEFLSICGETLLTKLVCFWALSSDFYAFVARPMFVSTPNCDVKFAARPDMLWSSLVALHLGGSELGSDGLYCSVRNLPHILSSLASGPLTGVGAPGR